MPLVKWGGSGGTSGRLGILLNPLIIPIPSFDRTKSMNNFAALGLGAFDVIEMG